MGKQDGYKIVSTYTFKAVNKSPDKVSHDEIRLKDGKIFVGCGRCNNIETITRFRIHHDNYPSFFFHCSNCSWSYSCYRGSMGELKQVEKALAN